MSVDAVLANSDERKFWDQALLTITAALVPKALSVRPEPGEDTKLQIELIVSLAARIADVMLEQKMKRAENVTIRAEKTI